MRATSEFLWQKDIQVYYIYAIFMFIVCNSLCSWNQADILIWDITEMWWFEGEHKFIYLDAWSPVGGTV